MAQKASSRIAVSAQGHGDVGDPHPQKTHLEASLILRSCWTFPSRNEYRPAILTNSVLPSRRGRLFFLNRVLSFFVYRRRRGQQSEAGRQTRMGTINKRDRWWIGMDGIWDGKYTGCWRTRERFRRWVLVIRGKERHRCWWRKIRRCKPRKRSTARPILQLPNSKSNKSACSLKPEKHRSITSI